MKTLPTSLRKIAEFFQKLPGIGPKSSRRLAFYLLRLPQSELQEVSQHLSKLKQTSNYCSRCLNLTEDTLCAICTDTKRDTTTIAVVEEVLDLLALEAGESFNGLYHVLHGRIDPLNYIGPDDIHIASLIQRASKGLLTIKEIIMATNATTEGEATAMYIKKKLAQIPGAKFKITRLAYGLPMGADLEYADFMTVQKALKGRLEF